MHAEQQRHVPKESNHTHGYQEGYLRGGQPTGQQGQQAANQQVGDQPEQMLLTSRIRHHDDRQPGKKRADARCE